MAEIEAQIRQAESLRTSPRLAAMKASEAARGLLTAEQRRSMAALSASACDALVREVVVREVERAFGERIKGPESNRDRTGRAYCQPHPTALTPTLQKKLEASLAAFQSYLTGLGYRAKPGQLRVHIDPALSDNAYYDGERKQMVVAAAWAEDTDVLFREYMHHALIASRNAAASGLTPAADGIESGLADYFAASYNNDPAIGEIAAVDLRKRYGPASMRNPYIRNLKNTRKFTTGRPKEPRISQDEGEIWGGASGKCANAPARRRPTRSCSSHGAGLGRMIRAASSSHGTSSPSRAVSRVRTWRAA
jgi:hypothetical protein